MSDELDLEALWPRKGDRLFGLSGDRRLHAVIIGDVELFPHIEGYKRAADILVAELKKEPRLLGVAYIVFPVVFLYRHFVELSLKEIIAQARYLQENRTDFPRVHELDRLWRDVRQLIEQVGPGCTTDDLDAMESLIGELHMMDPLSFAFRYPTTKDGQLSLGVQTEFNLEQFCDSMAKMAGFFDGARSMLVEYKNLKNSIGC